MNAYGVIKTAVVAMVQGFAIVAFAVVVAGMTLNDPTTEGAVMVQETVTVAQGDTLWRIAERYCAKNTYGARDPREFVQGVIELNYDVLGKRPDPAMIYPGDQLRINYWRLKE